MSKCWICGKEFQKDSYGNEHCDKCGVGIALPVFRVLKGDDEK